MVNSRRAARVHHWYLCLTINYLFRSEKNTSQSVSIVVNCLCCNTDQRIRGTLYEFLKLLRDKVRQKISLSLSCVNDMNCVSDIFIYQYRKIILVQFRNAFVQTCAVKAYHVHLKEGKLKRNMM